MPMQVMVTVPMQVMVTVPMQVMVTVPMQLQTCQTLDSCIYAGMDELS